MVKEEWKGGAGGMLAQAIGYDSKEDVIQNLRDAGCGPETIRCFMECMAQDDLGGQFRLMREQRECLLERVHAEEKQIECLDYLVYRMERSRKNMKKTGGNKA